MNLPQDIGTEELQYILWQHERLLGSWPEAKFQIGRHVASMADALGHARWSAHQAQYENDHSVLLATLGFVQGVLWSWGVMDLDMLGKQMDEWLHQLRERATSKLTGYGLGGAENPSMQGMELAKNAIQSRSVRVPR